MPDFVPIQDLTIAGSVDDNDLFPMSDGIGAYAVRGSTIKSYAASDAAAAAADAALSKTAAQSAATAAGNAQTAAEAAVSTADSVSARMDDVEDAINKDVFNINVTSEYNTNFSESNFIGATTGKWSSNGSYPYLYSERAYFGVSSSTPLGVTMGNSAMKFRLHLYSSAAETGFVVTTNWQSGDKKLILNGKWENYDYSYVRFTVCMVDYSYSTAIYNSLVAAFTLMANSDPSLSLKRAPADAKTTGDKFAKIQTWEDSVLNPANLYDLTVWDFASDYYNNDSGAYANNLSYPHIFGAQLFIRVDEKNPVIVDMGSDDYQYKAYFYDDITATTFVALESSYHKGSVVTAYNGYYNNQTYRYIRFNIQRTDGSYTTSDFNACVAAFRSRFLAPFLPRRTKYFGYNRFYVRTNLEWPDTQSTAVDTGETADEVNLMAVLALPSSYRPNGAPVPLIMFGHGASAHITEEYWYAENDNFQALIDAFLSAGYAVFDVDNTRGLVGGYPDWGNLPLMTAYIHAWDYIKANFNVEDKLYIYSASMGTCASLMMMKWYPDSIVCALQSAPRPFSKYWYEHYTNGEYHTTMAESFGLGESGEWDTDRLRGFTHYDNRITIGNDDYIMEKFPPLKVMVGTSDTSALTEVREYYADLNRAGNYINYREVSGANHGKMTFLSEPELRAEAVAWFDRFRNYSPVEETT